MLSTDNNINNNTRVIEVDLTKQWDAFNPNRVEYVTREWYDLKQTHDPSVTYVIKDAKPGHPEVYIGDRKVNTEDKAPEYLLGINSNNEYVIYMHIHNYSDILPAIIPIKRFVSAQSAIDALRSYKRVGTPQRIGLLIHNALATYIRKEAGIHETIMAIIAGNGYRDDPRLQQLNERAISFGYHTGSRDIPAMMRQMLHNLANKNELTLWSWYSKIYDIFVLYEFFVDKKYTEPLPEELELSEPISYIIDAMK